MASAAASSSHVRSNDFICHNCPDVAEIQKLRLKFISFQAMRNQTSPRHPSARATSCSLLQNHRPGTRQFFTAFITTRTVPITQSTPPIPKTATQAIC